ncbi:hypothetical protein [Ruania zhangjianzhongii]|nr:hypothetical protein [Ruania zhangjianzhongii]
MRTTLDIDPVVLSAARAKAAAERISLGRAVGEVRSSPGAGGPPLSRP